MPHDDENGDEDGDEPPRRPAETGRLSPEVLGELASGDYVEVSTESTRAASPRAEHGIGNGDLYCVVDLEYRDAIPDVYVRPVAGAGAWPDPDTQLYVIVSGELGVALSKQTDDGLVPVQPVDELQEVG